MKSNHWFILFAVLLLVSTALVDGRIVHEWSEVELLAKPDLVVIATPKANRDTNEHVVDFLGSGGPQVVAVETKFAISEVLKGDKRLMTVVLHHYRLPDGVLIPPSAPDLVTFDPAEKRRFRLYLVREADGRSAPAAGQLDAGMSLREIREMRGSSQSG